MVWESVLFVLVSVDEADDVSLGGFINFSGHLQVCEHHTDSYILVSGCCDAVSGNDEQNIDQP